MHVVLMSIGSAGDIHPLVRVGTELRDRGHSVTLSTVDVFQPLAEAEGFRFISLGNRREYDEIISNPRLWHPRRGATYFVRNVILPFMRRQYAVLEQCVAADECDVVIAPGTCLGARIAHDKLGVNLATAHLSPFFFRSVFRNRRVPGLVIPDWVPHSWKRGIFRLGDRVGDLVFGRKVNEFRAELGLPPAENVFWDWWNSPQLILAMFPEWFAAPQPDWPSQTRLAGFPLYDQSTVDSTTTPELEDFLKAGLPPIVFTAGTAMAHAKEFFATSLAAVQQLGHRAIFLAQHAEQLPSPLPDQVRWFSYLPFSQVLPRAAAIVHHGGVGTMAQSLRAGIPQLVVPLGFDQPENASRVVELGVGVTLHPHQYSHKALIGALSTLMEPVMRQNCRAIAEKFVANEGLADAILEIETLAGQRTRSDERTCVTSA